VDNVQKQWSLKQRSNWQLSTM